MWAGSKDDWRADWTVASMGEPMAAVKGAPMAEHLADTTERKTVAHLGAMRAGLLDGYLAGSKVAPRAALKVDLRAVLTAVLKAAHWDATTADSTADKLGEQ